MCSIYPVVVVSDASCTTTSGISNCFFLLLQIIASLLSLDSSSPCPCVTLKHFIPKLIRTVMTYRFPKIAFVSNFCRSRSIHLVSLVFWNVSVRPIAGQLRSLQSHIINISLPSSLMKLTTWALNLEAPDGLPRCYK